MPPRFVNVFFDRGLRQGKEKAIGKRVKLRVESGGGWEVKQVI